MLPCGVARGQGAKQKCNYVYAYKGDVIVQFLQDKMRIFMCPIKLTNKINFIIMPTIRNLLFMNIFVE